MTATLAPTGFDGRTAADPGVEFYALEMWGRQRIMLRVSSPTARTPGAARRLSLSSLTGFRLDEDS